MKILIHEPIAVKLEIGAVISYYSFSENVWCPATIINIDNENSTVTFYSELENIKWTEKSLSSLSNPAYYNWINLIKNNSGHDE